MTKVNSDVVMDHIDYDKPATTEAERRAMAEARTMDHIVMANIHSAARALVNDFRRRHPDEALCPLMRDLDTALEAELEIDRKVFRNIYSEHPDMAARLIRLAEESCGVDQI